MLVAQLNDFSPRKAVKATLVLLPLLGITYMLFFVNPGEDEISRIVFIYFNSFLESFQVKSSALAPSQALTKGCGGAQRATFVSPHSFSIRNIDLPKPRRCSKATQPWGSSAVTLTFVSFQGFFVSVFYCFLNSEVSTGGAGVFVPILMRGCGLSLRLCPCTGTQVPS